MQNIFDLCFYSESGAWLPTAGNSINDDKVYPRLSERLPPESPSSEDLLDNVTNGTASNDDSSSDDARRRSTDQSVTRMNQESEEEDNPSAIKVSFTNRQSNKKQVNRRGYKKYTPKIKLTYGQNVAHRPKQERRMKAKNKPGHQKQLKKYGKGRNKRQQTRQAKEKARNLELNDSFDSKDVGPDGGPLIRLREALIVDWSDDAYENIFVDSSRASSDVTFATFDSCETLPDPDLDKAQAARKKRRTNGTTLAACLDEFEREEILSEQDMWFCPRCKEHRRASKKFDIWKTPDILIIHLKRFSSSGFRRDKLEVLVDFPTEDLDITSRVLHKEDGKQEVYDLIGVDCHWGGLGGGHYTAQAKNFIDGQWYNYNGMCLSIESSQSVADVPQTL